ncbi:TonB-dependent receptor [Indibacter alkaliphilus LW1]|uniref:TonB-dependent receptor n=1 Tax=Indibacter alkaliphilus (strain CCUG 57479 / KCTC 22604 / LW1) TaxID=1189612 RepID=S2DFV1_INDAL|nr:TonB-dependent receptor [Indibacter alkaliphilus]EOZ97814.1 TonB-dependent receptor [Indibacter alkaliphilus LW1]
MMKHYFKFLSWLGLLVMLGVYYPSDLSAQSGRTVQGVVRDSNTSEGIPGVNVIEKGTSNGTITDLDGSFSLTVSSENSTLEISFIGYTKREILVGNQTQINVNLDEDMSDLGEVVVVGYGVQQKANLTGAVSTVGKELLENRPVANVANALQGTTPGLNITRSSGQPGSEGINIQVRGATSANGNVNPLLMVDGVPAPLFTMQTLNPNDIESVTVLKDAAAAAIYGAQASGGVILVTTKAGQSGKTVFEYSNMIGTEWALNIPERMSLLEEAQFSNLARANRGLAPEYNDEALQYIRDGVEFVEDPNDPNRWITFNQQSIRNQVLRRNSPMQTHNFSARGGNDRTDFLVSLGYFEKAGVFKLGPDSFDRYNVRINLGSQLTKHIRLDSRVAYSRHNTEAPSVGAGGYGLLQQVYQARTRFPIFMPDGRLFGGAGTSGNNAYAILSQGGYDNTTRNDFDGVFTATAKDFVKGLQVRAIYGQQYRNTARNRFARTVDLWNKGGDDPAFILNNPNVYEITNQLLLNTSFQFLVDYDLEINDKNKIHFLGGYQYEDYRFTSQFSQARDLISNDLPSLNLSDENSRITNESINTYANQSFFARLNYSYAGKYLLEATVRSDESSRLAPGMRTQVFPSASIGWNIHRENFLQDNLGFLSELKLRASWGRLGSALGIGFYDYLSLLARNSNLILGAPGQRATYFWQNVVPSSTLSWENIETVNFGTDLGFFDNKLQASFDYYIKHNRNMLTPLQLPGTFGVGTPRVNEGVLKSWGWELELRYRDKIGENFNYNVALNLSDNQNILMEFAGRNVVGLGLNNIVEGYPLGTIWGYQTAPGYFSTIEEVQNAPFQDNNTGVGDIRYINQDGDERITPGRGTTEDPGDMVLLGTNQERLLFGINLSANYKNFDFVVFFQGVGRRSFLPTRDMLAPMMQGWFMPMAHHSDYWTPENPNAAFPRPFLNGFHNYLPSDRWVLDGSYIRLKNIQVGYSFSPSLLKRANINRARIFVSGQDIWTRTSMGVFNGVFDPENNNNVRADYPFFGTVAGGINLTF